MIDFKRRKIDNDNTIVEYDGYSIDSNDIQIDILDEFPNSEEFFNKFIKLRKPCKFTKSILSTNIQNKFKLENINKTLDYKTNYKLKKKLNGGFGNGGENSRIKMNFNDLCDKFKQGNCDYYLTTQYDFDDPEQKKENEEENEEENHEEESEQFESDEEEEEIQGQGLFDNFSDTSSIDFNNLHDDFEDEEEEIIEDEENDESSNLSRIIELFQPPLTNLINKSNILPLNPSFISTLIPQQINLWMGTYKPTTTTTNKIQIDESKSDFGLGKQIPNNGTSSGLHHDHADNLYILISGKKRFTIYSPKDALKLYTIGEIYKIYSSGIIDYKNSKNWKRIRDDGGIIEDIINWKIKNETNEIKKIQLLKELRNEIEINNSNNQLSSDPPSFSKIPPCLLHLDEIDTDLKLRAKLESFLMKFFPKFLNVNKLTIWLNEGEMLYLPCGWFHEVSSLNSKDSNCHIALNYWFIPPNSNEFDKPYKDDYWKQDWEKTLKIIEKLKIMKLN